MATRIADDAEAIARRLAELEVERTARINTPEVPEVPAPPDGGCDYLGWNKEWGSNPPHNGLSDPRAAAKRLADLELERIARAASEAGVRPYSVDYLG
jgi:hypothetical protein